MKKKYLILTGLLFAWMGAQPVSAQTDVTAQYLTNPDFEGTYEEQTRPSNDRAIYKPEGWTVSLDPLNTNDMSILKTSDLASNNFSNGFTVNDEATRGAQTYWFRYRWGSNQTLKLSQSIENLPAGVYRLTADVLNYSTNYNYTVMIYAGSYAQSRAAVSTSKEDNWNTLSCDFYVENDGNVEIGFSATNPTAVERIFAVDNFKLYKLDAETPSPEFPVSMNGYIVNPCFDSNTNGWTSTTGAQNRGLASNKGGAITGNFYENWNSGAYSGTIEQTINNLPLGVYTIRLAAFRSGGTENACAFANDDMTSVTTTDGEWYEVTTKVTDGTLTFGVKSIDGGCNWMGVDNASLMYQGVDLDMLKDALASALKTAKELDQTLLNTYAKTQLNVAISAAENVKEEEKSLKAATEELLKYITLANDIALIYPSATRLIELCVSEKDNSCALDKTVFDKVIEDAKVTFESAESVEELTKVINTLEAARQAYVLVAQPKEGYSFDLTFKINNAAVASTDGWNGAKTNNDQQYTGAPDNTYFDIWNSNIHVTQEVSGLPEGLYSLKAATRGSSDVSTGNIYVEFEGNTARTDIYHLGSSGNELGNGWGWTVVDGINVVSGNIKIGFYAECGSGKWAGADDFHLTYAGVADASAAYEAQKNLVQPLLASKMNAEVRATVTTLCSLTADNTRDELLQAMFDLKDATTAAEASIAAYAYLQREVATAKSLGLDVTTVENNIAAESYTTEAAIAEAQVQNVVVYNKVKESYTYEVPVEDWTGGIGTTTTQHWSGDASRSYYDTNGTDISKSLATTVTLPAGEYVLMAAGRSASNATMDLKIDDTTVRFTAKGDTGYGIEISGQANFSESGTYANGGVGRGWEWEYVHLKLTEEKTVNLSATITTTGWAWGSFSDITLKMDQATFEAVYYKRLQAALEECKPWNTGNTYADTTYPEYESAYNNKTYKTVEEIEAAIAALKEAFDVYALENIDAEHPYDMTSKIVNPNYDNGITGWERTQNSTDGYTDGVNADGAYYYSFTKQMRHATCYQTISLPAGTYRLSATMTGEPYTETSTYIYATTGAVDHWGNPVFAGDVWYGYYTPVRDWDAQNVYTLFTLKEDAEVRIGALSWGRNASGNTRGGFTVDNWKLEKLLYAVEGEVAVSCYGEMPISLIKEMVVAGAQSVDVTNVITPNLTISVESNPNLIIYANEGQVENLQNVIVDGTCANLVLADGHPFAAPKAFTATKAAYNMTAVATTADGKGFGTLCLPFEATTLAGLAYKLDQGVTAGGELYATKVTTVPANTPVLVTAQGTYSAENASVAAVKATDLREGGELVGVYAPTQAPVGSYVLQKHSDKVAFYPVMDVQPTVKPFRAYIRPQSEAASLDMLSVVFDFGDVTAIEGVESAEGVKEVSRHDAAGMQLSRPQKGLNIIRMSDGSVRKVIIK